ncbi:hypothetical protein BC834DRAFT_128321 [Gloeopeniophorella convolvens]|nr:hypothetical protein BC834DRAFT_128321 [Gloeopeniophorella convolvens]
MKASKWLLTPNLAALHTTRMYFAQLLPCTCRSCAACRKPSSAVSTTLPRFHTLSNRLAATATAALFALRTPQRGRCHTMHDDRRILPQLHLTALGLDGLVDRKVTPELREPFDVHVAINPLASSRRSRLWLCPFGQPRTSLTASLIAMLLWERVTQPPTGGYTLPGVQA